MLYDFFWKMQNYVLSKEITRLCALAKKIEQNNNKDKKIKQQEKAPSQLCKRQFP